MSSLQSGHARCVAGTAGDACRVAHHWHGRAADISAVYGTPVSTANVAARDLAEWLGRLAEGLAPAEVGSPWPDLAPETTHFSDSMHADHIHVGWPSQTR